MTVAARVAAGTVAGAIGLLGLTTLSAGLVVLLVVTTVLLGAGGGALASRDPERQVVGDVVRCGLFGCVSVLVAAGLTVLLGPVGVVIALVGVAFAGWRHWRRPGLSGAGTARLVADIRTLTDAELAREWKRSHKRLRLAPDAAALERVREQRRSQLDEMERRDPVGFRRWAGGGSWITGDTAPFLGT